jgi:phosphoserine phosphatase RsbU/P
VIETRREDASRVEPEERVADLLCVLEASRRLASLAELPPLLELVEQFTQRVLDCERAHVFLNNPYTEELIGQVTPGAAPVRLASGRGIVGEVFRRGASMAIADPGDPRLGPELDRPPGYRARNVLACPLLNGSGEALGVLVAANRRRGRSDDWDEVILKALAAQAGAVIQHLRIPSSQALRREHDLDAARTILQALLPKQPPSVAGFDVAGWNQPADETGGDFFDFHDRPDGNLAVTVADVSGHGVGPALVAAECRAFLRATLLQSDEPDVVIPQVNHLLCESLPENRFVTAFFGLLRREEHRLDYISAGHGPILFYSRAAGTFRELPIQGFPLGLSRGRPFGEPHAVAFAAGDFLAIVTDGFFEWLDPRGECYGIDRLQDQLRRDTDRPAAEIIRSLHQGVLAFSCGTHQLDDLAAVVIKRV